MPIAIGVWISLAGGFAALVGATGLRRIRRLRAHGHKVWAAVTPRHFPDGSSRSMLFRYELTDGRVVERVSSMPSQKAAALHPGQKVLVWYDPADPEDILVYGRKEWPVEAAFIVVGSLFILAGAGLAALGG
jgi:hypothetical protein